MSVLQAEWEGDRPEWAKRENAEKLSTYGFVAKLACGCTTAGETQVPEIVDFNVHGEECQEHGYQLFIDFVSTKPEVDKWGRS